MPSTRTNIGFYCFLSILKIANTNININVLAFFNIHVKFGYTMSQVTNHKY